MKQRGFGEGKYNGFGGKIEADEDPRSAAVREVWEEAGIRIEPEDLRPMGEITFRFPARPEFDHFVYLFVTHAWRGEPQDSEEMHPKWFPVESIPYETMWQDDGFWLPLVLGGGGIVAQFTFAEDNETVVEHSIRQVPPGRFEGKD
jgi:8-oxo-dGTP diphosphatase